MLLNTKPCPYCQASLPANAQFCNHCGARLPSGLEAGPVVSPAEFDRAPAQKTFPAWLLVGLIALFLLCLCGLAILGVTYFSRSQPASIATGSSQPEVSAPAFATATRTVHSTSSTVTPDLATSTPLPTRTQMSTVTDTLKWAQVSSEIYFAALRRSAGYSGKNDERDILAEVPAGARVQILDGPQVADGLNWWHVSWNGTQGWMAEKTSSGKVILIFEP